MSIFVVWDEPQRHILHIVYRPAWTDQHFEAALTRARAMLTQVDHQVDFIVDQQQVEVVARDLLRHAQRLAALTRHTNGNRIVLLGADRSFDQVQALAESGPQDGAAFHNTLFATSMDEAYEQLEEAAV